jgi:hypothetical protein
VQPVNMENADACGASRLWHPLAKCYVRNAIDASRKEVKRRRKTYDRDGAVVPGHPGDGQSRQLSAT